MSEDEDRKQNVASKILPGEIKSVPSSDEILKLLECPCCLEPPVPPIKTCASGHIICSFCRPRLTRCAICREPYTDCRNYPLETIFNGCTIACKFWGRGCQQIVSGDRFLEHVKICQYRTLCCSHCQESVSPVDQYVEHLKDKHNAFGYDQEESMYFYKNCISDLYNDCRLADQYAYFDGRYFIVSAQIRSQFIHIWLSLVEDLNVPANDAQQFPRGEEGCFAQIKKRAEQSHYHAVISISPDNSPVPLVVWTTPIYPLQNGEPDPAMIVNIPVNPTFRGFLTTIQPSPENSDVLRKYSWSFTYTISKDNANTKAGE